MTALLTAIGFWCIASALFAAGLVVVKTGAMPFDGTDLLFGMAGIGVLFLLLAGMVPA